MRRAAAPPRQPRRPARPMRPAAYGCRTAASASAPHCAATATAATAVSAADCVALRAWARSLSPFRPLRCLASTEPSDSRCCSPGNECVWRAGVVACFCCVVRFQSRAVLGACALPPVRRPPSRITHCGVGTSGPRSPSSDLDFCLIFACLLLDFDAAKQRSGRRCWVVASPSNLRSQSIGLPACNARLSSFCYFVL